MSDRYRFGTVHGPVSTGSPRNGSGQQVVGSGTIRVDARRSAGPDPAVLEALAGLRAELDELRLTGRERAAAAADLDRVEHAGDGRGAADALESFVRRVEGAGALAGAGATLTSAVTALAHALGPLAAHVVALL